MAIVVHDTDRAENNGSGKTIVANRPTNMVDGDMWQVGISTKDPQATERLTSSDITPPSGFLFQGEEWMGLAARDHVLVYANPNVSSPPASVNFVIGPGLDNDPVNWITISNRISGAVNEAFHQVATALLEGPNADNFDAPQVTTTEDGSNIGYFWGYNDSAGIGNTEIDAALSETFHVRLTSPSNQLMGGYETQATAGQTTVRNTGNIVGQENRWCAITIALAPAAAEPVEFGVEFPMEMGLDVDITSAPSTPTNFRFVSRTINSISTSWTDNSGGTASYRLGYQLASDDPETDPFTLVATLGPGSDSYTFDGLAHNTQYRLAIVAFIGSSEGELVTLIESTALDTSILYENDFGDDTVGVQPPNTTLIWNTANRTYTVENVAGFDGGKGLRCLHGAGTSNTAITFDDADGTQNVQIEVERLRFEDATATAAHIVLRAAGNAGTETGYILAFIKDVGPDGEDEARLLRWENGSLDIVVSGTVSEFEFFDNDEINAIFGADEGVVTAKYWRDGEPEPEEDNWSFTDPDPLPAGDHGIGRRAANGSIVVDKVTITQLGAIAELGVNFDMLMGLSTTLTTPGASLGVDFAMEMGLDTTLTSVGVSLGVDFDMSMDLEVDATTTPDLFDVFEDDFTGQDGDPPDGSKWTVDTSSGSFANIIGDRLRLIVGNNGSVGNNEDYARLVADHDPVINTRTRFPVQIPSTLDEWTYVTSVRGDGSWASDPEFGAYPGEGYFLEISSPQGSATNPVAILGKADGTQKIDLSAVDGFELDPGVVNFNAMLEVWDMPDGDVRLRVAIQPASSGPVSDDGIWWDFEAFDDDGYPFMEGGVTQIGLGGDYDENELRTLFLDEIDVRSDAVPAVLGVDFDMQMGLDVNAGVGALLGVEFPMAMGLDVQPGVPAVLGVEFPLDMRMRTLLVRELGSGLDFKGVVFLQGNFPFGTPVGALLGVDFAMSMGLDLELDLIPTEPGPPALWASCAEYERAFFLSEGIIDLATCDGDTVSPAPNQIVDVDTGNPPIWGDTIAIKRTIRDLPEGETVVQAFMTIKRQDVDSDGEAVLQLSITPDENSHGQITNDVDYGDAELRFTIWGFLWNNITPERRLSYDIQFRTSSDSISTREKGAFLARREVTQTN